MSRGARPDIPSFANFEALNTYLERNRAALDASSGWTRQVAGAWSETIGNCISVWSGSLPNTTAPMNGTISSDPIHYLPLLDLELPASGVPHVLLPLDLTRGVCLIYRDNFPVSAC